MFQFRASARYGDVEDVAQWADRVIAIEILLLVLARFGAVGDQIGDGVDVGRGGVDGAEREAYWEYNDEFTSAEGEVPRTTLFFDQALADAECQRLCAGFYAAETPAEFEADFATYFDEATHRDFDEHAVTWEALRERGFPDPYYVLELDASERRGAS